MTQRELPLEAVYNALYGHYGPQRWWPGRTSLEVCVGAVLTQNTSWANVEKAIRRLKREKALHLQRLYDLPETELAAWLHPVGYFNVKAKRLKNFVTLVVGIYDGRLDRLLAEDTSVLRETLLSVNGIGPETADSILLYAARRPVFVVDAYTRRFMSRHGWLSRRASYDDVAQLFTRSLPEDVGLYNEYHALIVALGKEFCRRAPRCDECPLRAWLPADRTPRA